VNNSLSFRGIIKWLTGTQFLKPSFVLRIARPRRELSFLPRPNGNVRSPLGLYVGRGAGRRKSRTFWLPWPQLLKGQALLWIRRRLVLLRGRSARIAELEVSIRHCLSSINTWLPHYLGLLMASGIGVVESTGEFGDGCEQMCVTMPLLKYQASVSSRGFASRERYNQIHWREIHTRRDLRGQKYFQGHYVAPKLW
jgi:hypothetical protein